MIVRWTALLLGLSMGTAIAQTPPPTPTGLVPRPVSVTPQRGHFAIDRTTQVFASDEAARPVATLFAEALRQQRGWSLPVRDGVPAAGDRDYVVFETQAVADAGVARERYRLDIGEEGIRVSGAPAGLFYGWQSLRQLLPSDTRQPLRLAAQRIEDTPRFAYRGMHLDVGRHLFPVDFIKKYLDLMAQYKLNTFHWHLTEDQGWRIEIKRYPKLTEIGSQRKETVKGRQLQPYVGDGVPYGGFYTQEQVREVVAYAQARHITVIPEIELPGHSLAALAAYPELACTPGPFEVGTTWGVFDDIYCPKEETFTFLQNVLDEVVALFPAPYVHIGGDEAPKTRWESSPVAQAVIKREGLKNEHELQSYFIRRIETFLHTRGKRIIGWDEILEGGLAPDATVMSWRGISGGIAAARQRHDVIMTPTGCCYFDYGQGPAASELWGLGGELPIERVYAYDPVPAELTPEEQRHILGVQANVWTEYLPTTERVEYMIAPRMLALAEVAWTPQAQRDFGDFQRRLRDQFPRLDVQRVAYRIPAPEGLSDALRVQRAGADGDAVRHTLALTPAVPGATLRYTTDGSAPDENSPLYRKPIALTVPLNGERRVRVLTFTPAGRRSAVHEARIAYRGLKPAQAPGGEQPGLRYRVFDGAYASMADFERDAFERATAAAGEGTALSFDPTAYGRKQAFGLAFEGWLQVPEDGVYRFGTQADDRSALYIDEEAVVRNDSYDQIVEGRVPLQKGWHRLRVNFYQRYGGIGLNVLWAPPQARALAPLEAAGLTH